MRCQGGSPQRFLSSRYLRGRGSGRVTGIPEIEKKWGYFRVGDQNEAAGAAVAAAVAGE
jgi:hypothetical protein